MIKTLKLNLVLFIVRLREVILDPADPKYVSVSAYERLLSVEVRLY